MEDLQGTCMRGIQVRKRWDSEIGKSRIQSEEIPPVHYNEGPIQLASLYGP